MNAFCPWPPKFEGNRKLKNLKVPSQNNTLVPLTAVADIRLGSGPAQIDRYDRARQVSLEANLQGVSLGDAVAAVRKLPAMNPLPPGVVEQPAGDAEIMGEIFARFGTAVAVAVLCIYALSAGAKNTNTDKSAVME